LFEHSGNRFQRVALQPVADADGCFYGGCSGLKRELIKLCCQARRQLPKQGALVPRQLAASASSGDCWSGCLGSWGRTIPGRCGSRHIRGAFDTSFTVPEPKNHPVVD